MVTALCKIQSTMSGSAETYFLAPDLLQEKHCSHLCQQLLMLMDHRTCNTVLHTKQATAFTCTVIAIAAAVQQMRLLAQTQFCARKSLVFDDLPWSARTLISGRDGLNVIITMTL